MTLRNLEVFMAVVEHGSMRAAAEKLYISQPSVSGAVSELESECSARLFDRIGKRLYITPAGRSMASYAGQMLSLSDEMKRKIGSVNDAAPLHIGATVTVGTCFIIDAIKKLGGTPPYVFVNNTHVIEEKLLSNALDAAVVEGHVKSPDLIGTPIINDKLCMVCSKDSQLATRKEVSLEELFEQKLLVREPGSGTRLAMDEICLEKHFHPEILWESNNTQALLNAVSENFGVAMLSARLTQDDNRLKCIPIASELPQRQFTLVVHKDKFITERLSQFIEIIKQYQE